MRLGIPFRRLPRYSLRALLVTMAVCGVAFGWATAAQRQKEAIRALRASNPSVDVAYEVAADGRPLPDKRSALRAWLQSRLGIDYVASPTRVEMLYPIEDDLRVLARLPSVEVLVTGRSIDLTDDSLRHLAAVSKLRELVLFEGDALGDEGMAQLARLKSLGALRMTVPPKVTPAGIAQLAKLKSLRQLDLTFDHGTSAEMDAAVERLRVALPACEIKVVRPKPTA